MQQLQWFYHDKTTKTVFWWGNRKIQTRREQRRKSLSLAYQLGYYVGQQIVDRHLPTLSCDEIQTRNTISVTCAEGDEYRRLNGVWFDKYCNTNDKDLDEDKPEWKALRAHHKILEDKYIPKILECYFSLLNIEDEYEDEFKRGVGIALWDCDCSYYCTEPENIDIKIDEHQYFNIITLKKA